MIFNAVPAHPHRVVGGGKNEAENNFWPCMQLMREEKEVAETQKISFT
jgi:hypothetical protein